MKACTIIGGVNGTGKNSLTGVLKAQRADMGTVIDVDKITAKSGGNAMTGASLAAGKRAKDTPVL